ncbi:MAG: RHS repeat-associated core domain-containing protein, partial [Bacillota bacterium]
MHIFNRQAQASVSYSYYDFGSPDTTTHFDINWSGPDNLFGYTGYEWDKVAEMWYAKARYYNSDLGRFAAEDPLKGTIADIQSLNLYPYVKNNPLKYVDLDGRQDRKPPSPSQLTNRRTAFRGDGCDQKIISGFSAGVEKALNEYKDTLDLITDPAAREQLVSSIKSISVGDVKKIVKQAVVETVKYFVSDVIFGDAGS